MKILFLKFDLKFYLKLGGDEMTTDTINRVKRQNWKQNL